MKTVASTLALVASASAFSAPVSSWYDSGVRLGGAQATKGVVEPVAIVSSWYDSGVRLTPPVAPPPVAAEEPPPVAAEEPPAPVVEPAPVFTAAAPDGFEWGGT